MARRVDDPRCNHTEHETRVTSLSDDQEWKTGMGMRAVWVCRRRACILDAMAWVERGSGVERSYVYLGPIGSPLWDPNSTVESLETK